MSMGDPAGIGPEVILKASGAFARKSDAPALFVLGDLAAMTENAARIRGVPRPIKWNPGEPIPASGKLGVLEMSELPASAHRPGAPTVEGGEASFRYVLEGVRMALAGEIDGLVTAPISKEGWHRAGHNFPGHSELIAKLSKVRDWRMMFAGSELRLALVTIHIALRKVPGALREDKVFDTIAILDRHMREKEGRAKPRVAVLGLNPHAGEGGAFGDEEIRIIEPAIARAHKAGIDAFGPLASDTAFVRSNRGFNFDAVVAMYHDQGLIALKTLEFDRAVNVTVGLPFIRTSPDHGTAFNIAGRGIANPSSMIAAIEYAFRGTIAGGVAAKSAVRRAG